MKKAFSILLNVFLLGGLHEIAGAATYYNSSPYQRYGANGGGYNSYSRSYASRYSQKTIHPIDPVTGLPKKQSENAKKTSKKSAKKQGFVGDFGLTHEFATWGFDMNDSGSRLRYDNVMWNVLDGKFTYYFGDTTPMQVNVGARYGLQFGDSPMFDDDVTNNGYLVTTVVDQADENKILGYQTGHALSIGTSKGGKQMGFNASIGLTDYFNWGAVKVTPSIGYRYFKHKLKTQDNYGTSVDIFEATNAHTYITCIEGYMGEIQCDPIVIFYGNNGSGSLYPVITGHVEDSSSSTGISDLIAMPNGTVMSHVQGVSTGGTYYYEQHGVSHEYTTTWAGPYLALDMDYEINDKNAVTGSVELGLPYYTSEGDQPYRYDWAHPKSIEDSGGLGDAIHLGLAAMWKTAVAESTMLSLGLTYDYYKVSNATAKTFLNPSYYNELYAEYQSYYNSTDDESLKAAYQAEMDDINEYRSLGWVLESPNEINSMYKSMGFRLGIDVKF